MPPLKNGTADLPDSAPNHSAAPESGVRLRPIAIKNIVEEKPLPAAVEDELIAAMRKVHAAGVARLRYHEGKAAEIRAAMADFASFGGQQPSTTTAEDIIRSVIAAADGLSEVEQ